MTHESAIEFMILILKQFVLTDDYPILKNLGISSEHFPSEFRSSATDFERVAKKNLSLAKSKYSVKFQELPGVFKRLSMTDVANNYHANAKAIRCYEFNEMVSRQPLDADRLARAFLGTKSESVELYDLKRLVDPAVTEINEQIKNGVTAVHIRHWPKFSESIGGFNPGTIITIPGQTGSGKSALALNLAACALETMSVIYFNMELLTLDIVKRIFMANGQLTRENLHTQGFEKNPVFNSWYSGLIGNENELLISDGRALSIEEITATISRENQKRKIGLVIVDYDQKIRTANSKDQWQELHRAVEELEEIAKFCELSIILLAQADNDGKGSVRASSRVTQSATAQMYFSYNEKIKQYVLEAKKNRHGVLGVKIIVNFQKEMSRCSEGDYFFEPLPDPEENKRRGY